MGQPWRHSTSWATRARCVRCAPRFRGWDIGGPRPRVAALRNRPSLPGDRKCQLMPVAIQARERQAHILMHRDQIDTALAARLVVTQFPEWADLAVVPVEADGWDNHTFRLGGSMTVRLPNAEAYASSVGKELTWLPRLAPRLPLPIPVPLAAGAPAAEYPWPWSVRSWIEGRPATRERISDLAAFGHDLAAFLRALQAVDTAGAPAAGPQNFHRGSSPEVYDTQTRNAITALASRIDAGTATEVWDAALAASWTDQPVWLHGDVAPGNLLVGGDGRLSAVIDFGTCGVGDPACDLVIAWTFLDDAGRDLFRARMDVDEAMWARARGWALWKALITIEAPNTAPASAESAETTICEVFVDHALSG